MIVNDFPTNSEYWRVIDGFPNYDVSTDGRVRNSTTGRIRKLQVKSHGHILVGLSQYNKTSFQHVHRLVASAFCIKTDDCNVVDHIDRNPSNNNYQNLRWTTTSGNCRNRTMHINNTSGTVGVMYNIKNGWIACWQNQDMKEYRKCFSVNKYGNEQAKQKAITHRKLMEEANGYLNV